MSQFELYKSFLFVVELLVAEQLFFGSLEKRNYFLLRKALSIVGCFLFAYAFPILENNAIYMSFMFCSIFAATIVGAMICYKESFLKISFCCVAGYTIQHFAYQINNLLITVITGGFVDEQSILMGLYGENLSPIFTNGFFTVCYLFIYFVTYLGAHSLFSDKLDTETFKFPPVLGFCLIVVLLVVDIVLNSIATHLFTTWEEVLMAGIYNLLCCALGLFLQFEVLLRWGYYSQLRMQNIVRRFEKERYATVRDTMEIVNIKCHDLKHDIRRLRDDNIVSEDAMNCIDKIISEHITFTATGNGSLDLVLTEFNRKCIQNNIKASYLADGSLISFMGDEDIYNLFLNLFDNAIEALMEFDPEERMMGLVIKRVGENMVSISVYNYCGDAKFEFIEGVPKTTKKIGELHGFGLRSVRRICQKYGGTMDIRIENKLFKVTMLFSVE